MPSRCVVNTVRCCALDLPVSSGSVKMLQARQHSNRAVTTIFPPPRIPSSPSDIHPETNLSLRPPTFRLARQPPRTTLGPAAKKASAAGLTDPIARRTHSPSDVAVVCQSIQSRRTRCDGGFSYFGGGAFSPSLLARIRNPAIVRPVMCR
jgi:hypothetical protein